LSPTSMFSVESQFLQFTPDKISIIFPANHFAVFDRRKGFTPSSLQYIPEAEIS
jgi:hypothetical protein